MERAEGVIVAERYRLVRQLGRGGMGSVWLADDLSLDTRCALKLIDDDKTSSEEVRVRFAREAKAAAQLRGPHVVDVFDRGEHDGVLYLAMEYLEGEDLGTRLIRLGSLSPESTYRIIAHVARALTSAHALGIVHRDLKPENVFLVPGYDEEIAKVVDFGIAQHEAYALKDRATRTGSFMGTPFYVSPEQARGKVTDHRTDLWSLGVIVFECLTGSPPFESESLGELMGLILYEPLPKPTQKNPDLPRKIDVWWDRAAARDREARFQSAKELADALREALAIDTVVAVSPLPTRRMGSQPSLNDGRVSLIPGDHYTPRAGEDGLGSPRGILTVTTPAQSSLDEIFLFRGPILRAIHGVWSRIRQGFLAELDRLRTIPRRTILAVALSLGVVLGAALSVAVAARWRQESPSTSRDRKPVGIVSPASTALDPTATSTRPDSPKTPPHVVLPEQLPLVPREGENSETKQEPRRRSPPQRTGRPVPQAPKPRPDSVPDYGI